MDEVTETLRTTEKPLSLVDRVVRQAEKINLGQLAQTARGILKMAKGNFLDLPLAAGVYLSTMPAEKVGQMEGAGIDDQIRLILQEIANKTDEGTIVGAAAGFTIGGALEAVRLQIVGGEAKATLPLIGAGVGAYLGTGLKVYR